MDHRPLSTGAVVIPGPTTSSVSSVVSGLADRYPVMKALDAAIGRVENIFPAETER